MMKFTLTCKCLLCEQLGVVQDFQPVRPVKRLSKNIPFVPLSGKPGQGPRCDEAKSQGTKGMGFLTLQRAPGAVDSRGSPVRSPPPHPLHTYSKEQNLILLS